MSPRKSRPRPERHTMRSVTIVMPEDMYREVERRRVTPEGMVKRSPYIVGLLQHALDMRPEPPVKGKP